MSVSFNAIQPAFTGAKKVDYSSEDISEKKVSTDTKVAVGLGAAALAAAGIYFATKGRGKITNLFRKNPGYELVDKNIPTTPRNEKANEIINRVENLKKAETTKAGKLEHASKQAMYEELFGKAPEAADKSIPTTPRNAKANEMIDYVENLKKAETSKAGKLEHASKQAMYEELFS